MRLHHQLHALFRATALFALTASFASSAGAVGASSYRVVEEVLSLDDGNPTALASSPNDPRHIYVGTSNGRVYASDDGARTWRSASVGATEPAGARIGRSHRWTYDLRWGRSRGMLLWTALGYPHVHGTFDLFLLDHMLAPQGFEIEELNPNPQIFRRMPKELRKLGHDRLQVGPEFHFHEIFAGQGGNADVLEAAEIRAALPRRLRSLLVDSGAETSPLIRALAVDPTQAATALAGTDSGLFRSDDGGRSWAPFGDLPRADAVHDLRYAPRTPGRWYACSERGLFSGDASGQTRPIHGSLARESCRFVDVVGRGLSSVWILSGSKLWRLDGGGAGRPIDLGDYGIGAIRSVSVSPGPGDRLLITGERALLFSDDGGESLRRIGVPAIGREHIIDATFGIRPDHLVLATDRDIWESADGGQTWRVVAFGHRSRQLRRFVPPPTPDTIWLLSGGAVVRAREGHPHQMSPDRWERVSERLADEPSLEAVVDEALQWHDLLPMPHLSQRSASWSNALPSLHVWGGYRSIAVPTIRTYSLAFGTDRPLSYATAGRIEEWHVMAYLSWEFDDLVFDTDTLAHGPEADASQLLARTLREKLAHLYVERRRLQLQAAAEGDGVDLRSTVMRDARIEELTHHIDALTDGVFQRSRRNEITNGVP